MRYRCRGEHVWRRGTTENISSSGVLFRADDPLPVAGDVELRLELPAISAVPGRSEVACRGHVVRTVAPSDDHPWQAAAIMIDGYDFVRHVELNMPSVQRGE